MNSETASTKDAQSLSLNTLRGKCDCGSVQEELCPYNAMSINRFPLRFRCKRAHVPSVGLLFKYKMCCIVFNTRNSCFLSRK